MAEDDNRSGSFDVDHGFAKRASSMLSLHVVGIATAQFCQPPCPGNPYSVAIISARDALWHKITVHRERRIDGNRLPVAAMATRPISHTPPPI